jgi:tRNA(adenine34) deaminase
MATHTHRRATKKSSTSKKKSAPKKRWVRKVTTDSTHPPKDLFTKTAPVIARTLASKKVSPRGPASGMRMLTYFINRAGKGLSATRRRELERAKTLLHERIVDERRKQKAA